MRSALELTVNGATSHVIPRSQLETLQALVAELGAVKYPLFLRLGNTQRIALQPVGARAVLAEVEEFSRQLQEVLVPGVRFDDPSGNDLGCIYSRAGDHPVFSRGGTSWDIKPAGIRVIVRVFPPPVGFRSMPGLAPGHYACYFRRLEFGRETCSGFRTLEMGGTGSPVTLPEIPVPPVTKWDTARVAGKPALASAEWIEVPISEVYRNIFHAFETACNDSIRLKQLLMIRGA